MEKKIFKSGFRYSLQNIELHTANQDDKNPKKSQLSVWDDITIESVTNRNLNFTVKRTVETNPKSVLSFFVEYVGVLTFEEPPEQSLQENLAYWKTYLTETDKGYVDALLGFASSIISTVTMTFGDRKPLVTPPSLIKLTD